MWAWIKALPAVVNLLNWLTRQWDTYQIKKAERIKIKSEILEAEKEERRKADETRNRLDNDPGYRDGVRTRFTRK